MIPQTRQSIQTSVPCPACRFEVLVEHDEEGVVIAWEAQCLCEHAPRYGPLVYAEALSEEIYR